MKISVPGVSTVLTGLAFVALAFLAPNCQPSGGDTPASNTGGSSTGGNNSNTGGSSSNTGGNSSNTGGYSNTGGTSSDTGGNSNTGGTSSTGGSSSSNTGGTSSSNTGGTSSTGGTSTATATGGVASTGGTTTPTTTPAATGGSGSTPTGTTVTFASGKAAGAMTGYGFVALGSLDMISDPTCGPTKAAITKIAPCAAGTNWTGTTSLCMTGNVPALGAVPDYANNWGVSVGLNATDPAGSGLGQAFTSIAIAVTGSPTAGLRALVHRKGDTVDTSYCAALTPGTPIPLTSFTTACYNTATPGTAITAADVPNIDQVTVQVSSSATAAAVTSLCITGITFAK